MSPPPARHKDDSDLIAPLGYKDESSNSEPLASDRLEAVIVHHQEDSPPYKCECQCKQHDDKNPTVPERHKQTKKLPTSIALFIIFLSFCVILTTLPSTSNIIVDKLNKAYCTGTSKCFDSAIDIKPYRPIHWKPASGRWDGWITGAPANGAHGELLHSFATFNFSPLSLPDTSIFFTSETDNAAGKLFIDTHSGGADTTSFSIHAYHKVDKALDVVSVSPLEFGQNGFRVDVQKKSGWGEDGFVNFEVFISLPVTTLPESRAPSTVIKHLDARVNDFDIHFQDPSQTAFDSIILATTNGRISADNLTANLIDVRTVNGAIAGNFQVFDHASRFGSPMTLRASNGEINANVTVVSSKLISRVVLPRGDSEAPQVLLATSNGRIDANFALVSTADVTATAPPYTLSATTSNAPVHIAFTDHPLNSSLHLTTHTSNALTDVALHPSYEGTYMLNTDGCVREGKEARVNVNDEVRDPSGEGRPRQREGLAFRDGTMGNVIWGELDDGMDLPVHLDQALEPADIRGKERRGTVVLTTNNAPIVLSL